MVADRDDAGIAGMVVMALYVLPSLVLGVEVKVVVPVAITRGSLLVADRLYGVPKFFAALAEHGLLGVCRRFGAVRLDRLLLTSSTVSAAGVLEDYDVLAGTPQRKRQTLRLLRLKVKGKVVLELFSNVLDRSQLSAVEAFDLYRARWKVERVFSDLKEVLSLNRFHAANTNAIGMQVFSAAIVHTALRIARRAAFHGLRAP